MRSPVPGSLGCMGTPVSEFIPSAQSPRISHREGVELLSIWVSLCAHQPVSALVAHSKWNSECRGTVGEGRQVENREGHCHSFLSPSGPFSFKGVQMQWEGDSQP